MLLRGASDLPSSVAGDSATYAPRLADSLNQTGVCLIQDGRMTEAEVLFEEVDEILGPLAVDDVFYSAVSQQLWFRRRRAMAEYAKRTTTDPGQ